MIERRDPEATRQAIVEAAFWEVFRHGFRATSVDQVLKETGVTKGAFYHHFASKTELGYALIDEMIGSWIHQHWETPLEASEDPVTTMHQIMDGFLAEMTPEMAKLGCPLNNLAQEMSSVDEEFRLRITGVVDRWKDAVADALRRGQLSGTVDAEVDANAAGAFVVVAIEGLSGMMKSTGGVEGALDAFQAFRAWLDSLRPASVPSSISDPSNSPGTATA